MPHHISKISFLIVGNVIFLTLFLLSVWGETVTTKVEGSPFIHLASDFSQSDREPYLEEVKRKLEKSRDLLEALKVKRDQSTSQEQQETLYAPIMKLTKQLEQAERVSKNLDVIHPQPWLRTKTEVSAVLADLDIVYEETFPLLHDRMRFLQDAVHHAKLAAEYGKDGRKNLFLKNTESAKRYASLAQEEGVSSELLQEGLSELEDAISHIQEGHLDAATSLTEGAYRHLHAAFKQVTNLQ